MAKSKNMKVLVLRTFRDKHTKSLHKAGTCLTMSRKRYEEINSAGYGQLVQQIAEESTEKAEG